MYLEQIKYRRLNWDSLEYLNFSAKLDKIMFHYVSLKKYLDLDFI